MTKDLIRILRVPRSSGLVSKQPFLWVSCGYQKPQMGGLRGAARSKQTRVLLPRKEKRVRFSGYAHSDLQRFSSITGQLTG